MVPLIGMREPRPSAKKLEGACARILGWRTISGKTSIGLPVLFCPRKPKMATSAIPKRTKIKRKPRNISVFVNDGDVLTAAAFEEFARLDLREARIARFNGQEETVVSSTT